MATKKKKKAKTVAKAKKVVKTIAKKAKRTLRLNVVARYTAPGKLAQIVRNDHVLLRP